MSKTNHPITTKKPTLKSPTMLNIQSWNSKTLNENFRKVLAEECIAFFEERPKVMVFERWLDHKGILDGTWDHYRTVTPEVDWAHQHVLRLIGIRREEAMMESKLPERSTMHMMPSYSKRWADREKVVAELKKETGNANNLHITWDQIPNTPEVPERK